MKATELMIGDWVYNSYHKKNIKWNYSEMFCPNGIPVIGRDLEPIPLTPEILEKNGFERGVITPSKFYRNTDNERLIFCPHSSCYGLGYVHWNESNDADIMHRLEVQQPIMYIHQMQHALRLFGLDQLADNFKL